MITHYRILKLDNQNKLRLMLLKFQIILNLCRWIEIQLIVKERDKDDGLAQNI